MELARREPAIGSATPARKRKSGAPRPAMNIAIAYARAWPIALAGPRVDHVGLYHDDDGDSPQPVEVGLPLAQR